MSGKLDKSLDELLSNRRRSARRSTRRSAASKATSAAAPAGGVKKSARAARAAAKNPQPGPSGTSGTSAESKIMVSGLPADVNEANIKEYFSKSAGPVKRVMLTYNQNGTSRGIASIVFSQSGAAAKAAKDLNGLLVDGRPMKIEVIVDASHAPGVEAPKPLTERVAQVNKSQPKAATSAKAAASGRGRRGRGRRTRNPNRSKPKSVEELDAEMVDYFSNENSGSAEGNAQVNGGAQQPQQQPASGGEDVGMAEIS